MNLYYEDFDANLMCNFIDREKPHDATGYFHSYKGFMYATDGKKMVRCKTKLQNGFYKPLSIESLHSSTVITGFDGEALSKEFDKFKGDGVKVKTLNLHDLNLQPTDAWNVVLLNLVDKIWFSFDHLSCCLTCDGRDFTFHYIGQDEPIYIKEEVYEFLCMPYKYNN